MRNNMRDGMRFDTAPSLPSGTETYNLAQPEPKTGAQMSPLGVALDNLEKQLTALDNTISALCAQIDPVMAPAYDGPEPACAPAAETAPRNSNVVEFVRFLTSRAASLRNVLELVRERIEV